MIVRNNKRNFRDEVRERINEKKKMNPRKFETFPMYSPLYNETIIENSAANIDTIARVENEACKNKVKVYMEHTLTNLLFMFVSVFSLLSDDFKLIATDKSADSAFSIIAIIIFLLFWIEILLSFYVDERYICSLVFWLDFISACSLLLDCHWIYDSIFDSSSDTLNAIKQLGKGGRITARTFRVLKFIGTIDLLNLINLKKMLKQDTDKSPVTPENEESQAGKKMKELITYRLIFLFALLILTLTVLNIRLFLNNTSKVKYSVDLFTTFSNYTLMTLYFNVYLDEFEQDHVEILYTKVYDKEYGDPFKYQDYRKQEIDIFYKENCYLENFSTYNTTVRDNFTDIELSTNNLTLYSLLHDNDGICEAHFNVRTQIKFSAFLSLLKTLLITFTIGVSAYLFDQNTKQIVSEPLEKMTRKIKNISENPIEAILHDKEETNDNDGLNYFFCCKCNKKRMNLETNILEITISKIGALLGLAFGEAGSEIIAKNMKASTEGDINPMIEGKKVVAIFGFCDIRNFTDTTEELQEDVMIFVNRIGEIVHEVTNECCGSANKNIGDAFLLVWKFDEKYVKIIKNTNKEARNANMMSNDNNIINNNLNFNNTYLSNNTSNMQNPYLRMNSVSVNTNNRTNKSSVFHNNMNNLASSNNILALNNLQNNNYVYRGSTNTNSYNNPSNKNIRNFSANNRGSIINNNANKIFNVPNNKNFQTSNNRLPTNDLNVYNNTSNNNIGNSGDFNIRRSQLIHSSMQPKFKEILQLNNNQLNMLSKKVPQNPIILNDPNSKTTITNNVNIIPLSKDKNKAAINHSTTPNNLNNLLHPNKLLDIIPGQSQNNIINSNNAANSNTANNFINDEFNAENMSKQFKDNSINFNNQPPTSNNYQNFINNNFNYYIYKTGDTDKETDSYNHPNSKEKKLFPYNINQMIPNQFNQQNFPNQSIQNNLIIQRNRERASSFLNPNNNQLIPRSSLLDGNKSSNMTASNNELNAKANNLSYNNMNASYMDNSQLNASVRKNRFNASPNKNKITVRQTTLKNNYIEMKSFMNDGNFANSRSQYNYNIYNRNKKNSNFFAEMPTDDIVLDNCPEINQIVDLALICFAKIIIRVHTSYVLDFYRKHEKLNKRIPNFCVKMGFGLHLGWAIEGAIGSHFKIDASYLSPHVNQAGKLEEGTKLYGVMMILSEEFVSYLSQKARDSLRIIDCLRDPKDGKNYHLYTLDICLDELKIETSEQDDENPNSKYLRKKAEKKETLKAIYQDKITTFWQTFAEDSSFRATRTKYTSRFYEKYNKGIEEYKKGNFKQARMHFIDAECEFNGEKNRETLMKDEEFNVENLNLIKDGPIKAFMTYIYSVRDRKPFDWNGFKLSDE